MQKNEIVKLGIIDIQLPQCVDDRGVLTFAEAETAIPFEIARVFWISDVPSGKSRGGHAHWRCHEALFAVRGCFEVEIDDGVERRRVVLNDPTHGVVIPAGAWCELRGFSDDALCLVFASEHYDAVGYCHNKAEWHARKAIEKNDI